MTREAARVLPIGGHNFVVRLVQVGPRGGAGREWDVEFDQVVLPTLRVDVERHPSIRPVEADATAGRDDVIVLRRGHTGSTELYDWWSAERDSQQRGSREVHVVVLDDVGRGVTRWSFTGCHLVALRYSPLDANLSSLLTETAEIAYETVAQTAA